VEVIPGPGGHITVAQAAALCGVDETTVRNWRNRGYMGPGGQRVYLRDAGKWKGQLLLDPVEVAKAEHATARRARRLTDPVAA
jgi:hypothetical protein